MVLNTPEIRNKKHSTLTPMQDYNYSDFNKTNRGLWKAQNFKKEIELHNERSQNKTNRTTRLAFLNKQIVETQDKYNEFLMKRQHLISMDNNKTSILGRDKKFTTITGTNGFSGFKEQMTRKPKLTKHMVQQLVNQRHYSLDKHEDDEEVV